MKMNKVIFPKIILMLILLMASYAMADTTVIGEDDPDIDVAAVQAAVDGGGIVTLQGTFNFGPGGRIFITNSVEIVGENATINNGRAMIVNAPGFDVTIRGSDRNNRLTFMNPIAAAVNVGACRSLIVKNVNIDGVADWVNFFGEILRYGIIAATWVWSEDFPFTPLSIGKLSIVDCTIDLGDYTDGTVGGRGISIFGVGTPENEVDILIKGNTVRNCSIHAVMLSDIAGAFIVKDNILRPGNKAANFFGTGANGIWTNQTSDDSFILPGNFKNYQPEWARATIVNNDVYCEPNVFPNGARALGVIAFRQVGTVIVNNKIRVDDGFACIGIDDGSDGFTVWRNVCSGNDLFDAIGVRGTVKNIKIINNDSTAATPEFSQISIWSGGNNILVAYNDLGPSGDDGGIYCAGYNNKFFNNTFHGFYPGWPIAGFMLLDSESHDNLVYGLKKGTHSHGDNCYDGDLNICSQVLDLGTNNIIWGFEDCPDDDNADELET